jgi:hypothetical protein
LEPNVWIKKFNQWKNIVKRACTAAAGPGGVYCMWIGRNCSYNDCPRRSLEEVYLKADEALVQELEMLRNELNAKTVELNVKTEQLTTLEEKLRTVEPQETINPKVESVEPNISH